MVTRYDECENIHTGNVDFCPCPDGRFVEHEDYAALQAENERLKSEAGYTAADVATAAADGFRDGVRSVDLEQFRPSVEIAYEIAIESHDEDKCTEAGRLLALIDAHKEG